MLPHCRAVVSHAGAGTMLGALCHGLPQLCLPQGTDQPFNTAALLPTGAALALQPEEITADAVAEALGRLLDEPSFRQAAEPAPYRDRPDADRRRRPRRDPGRAGPVTRIRMPAGLGGPERATRGRRPAGRRSTTRADGWPRVTRASGGRSPSR